MWCRPRHAGSCVRNSAGPSNPRNSVAEGVMNEACKLYNILSEPLTVEEGMALKTSLGDV